MAINEWRIWKRKGDEEEEEVKTKEDLGATIEFLKDLDVNGLMVKLQRMKEMTKEEKVVEAGLQKENLEKQIKLFDEIMKDYEFFVNDADINEVRLKRIGQELLKKAEAAGMKEVVKEKKKDLNWRS